MKLERFRKFNTRDVYPGGRLDYDMCMTVKAGPVSISTRTWSTPTTRRRRPTRP